jgi:putative endonuclease
MKPLDSVDQKKQARLRRAGERLWVERFADDPSVERMRFDVAGVNLCGPTRIELVKGAF